MEAGMQPSDVTEPAKVFKFDLKQVVCVKGTPVTATVVGRTEYCDGEPSYYVDVHDNGTLYRQAWAEGELEAA